MPPLPKELAQALRNNGAAKSTLPMQVILNSNRIPSAAKHHAEDLVRERLYATDIQWEPGANDESKFVLRALPTDEPFRSDATGTHNLFVIAGIEIKLAEIVAMQMAEQDEEQDTTSAA